MACQSNYVSGCGISNITELLKITPRAEARPVPSDLDGQTGIPSRQGEELDERVPSGGVDRVACLGTVESQPKNVLVALGVHRSTHGSLMAARSSARQPTLERSAPQQHGICGGLFGDSAPRAQFLRVSKQHYQADSSERLTADGPCHLVGTGTHPRPRRIRQRRQADVRGIDENGRQTRVSYENGRSGQSAQNPRCRLDRSVVERPPRFDQNRFCGVQHRDRLNEPLSRRLDEDPEIGDPHMLKDRVRS